MTQDQAERLIQVVERLVLALEKHVYNPTVFHQEPHISPLRRRIEADELAEYEKRKRHKRDRDRIGPVRA